MRKLYLVLISWLIFSASVSADPIKFKTYYPEGKGPFPVVISLHTSGGPFTKWMTIRSKVFVEQGFVVYEPDFFTRHNITHKNRGDTWTTFRKNIESELSEIVSIAKKDPKVNSKNAFAVGWSNGGYWATYLAATKQVNAGASVYGVWQFYGPDKLSGYPAKYVNENSNPILALHGKKETVQMFNSVMPFIKKAQASSNKVELHVYDNVGHSWDVNQSKDGYNKEVTEDANKRIVAFFKKNYQ
jgi:dienelactone hydrolase